MGRRSTGDAGFIGATFSAHVRFDGATFNGDARFDGTTFSAYAAFDRAVFNGDARFDKAMTVSPFVPFGKATTFTGDARFGGATFSRARPPVWPKGFAKPAGIRWDPPDPPAGPGRDRGRRPTPRARR